MIKMIIGIKLNSLEESNLRISSSAMFMNLNKMKIHFTFNKEEVLSCLD